ncbi:hypothetical protein Tco_1407231 [Tanacetum coccineum]
MMNGRVEYPLTHSTSPSETYAPYKPSPRIVPFEQPSCLGSTFVSKALRKSDQMHQTFEKSSLAMTLNLDDMIEFPKSQPKKTYKEDLECEIVMVKMPKCMSWLAYDEPIGDLDMMEDKVDNPSPQKPLNQTQLEDLGLNTYSHDISFSFRELPNVDEPKPQSLSNFPSLDVNLGDKRGSNPFINTYSPGFFEEINFFTDPGEGVRINPDSVARPVNFQNFKVKMDDPDITMEEYIRLEEEKARRHDFEEEFPAIVFKDVLMPEPESPCKLTEVVQEFKHRLAGIFSRRVHRVQVLEFERMTEEMGMDIDARLSIMHKDTEGLVVFTSHAWRRLFDSRRPLVRELMLDFLSTCRFDDLVLDLDADGVLSFQLGGARHTLSWRQFILAMVLHTTEEIDT